MNRQKAANPLPVSAFGQPDNKSRCMDEFLDRIYGILQNFKSEFREINHNRKGGIILKFC
jgi:hypothetical protein